jgi:type I restriction enzyme M protein
MPKPTFTPSEPFPKQEGDWLWIPLRNEWRDVRTKPEEIVRQAFIRNLVTNYEYSLDQMDQERRTMHGHHSPRADVVVWESVTAKSANASPILVVETKAENIEIIERDYYQGESYTRAVGCEFFVANNARFTGIFRLIPGAPGEFTQINEIPKATDWGDAKRLAKIREGQRAFNRKEFQDLLFECHSILRDVHKMDPGDAFDTMSKVLFIKMYIERSGNHGTFTTDFIKQRAASRLPNDPEVHDGLFSLTKEYYRADHIFGENEKLNISSATFERIVKKLERFDLSKTSDDIKGLAFERFLGSTFRGNLGQFFTPRPVVNFMTAAINPHEGELICDPAAGSGGFLIHAFEHVRRQIVEDVQAQKDSDRAAIEAEGLGADESDAKIEAAFSARNRELLPSDDHNQPIDTRVGRLAWRCVFGADASPRSARTAKMNMIMHGDGHGGIHHHDGLVDINGIFPGRFDIVLTNPPFGSNVGDDQKLGASAETSVPNDAAYVARGTDLYGEQWRVHHDALAARAAANTKILDLFEIGKGKKNRATEIVFVERCLKLLKPGGRMAIILPDGNLNNPSLDWLRRWCEGQAIINAVVSLPEATFVSSKATVKASIVFLTRFSESDEARWANVWSDAHASLDAAFDAERDTIVAQCNSVGVKRDAAWLEGDPPAYPAGQFNTKLSRPLWTKDGKDAGEKALSAAKVALRDVDTRHSAALWAQVRAAFDYPVFLAAPKAVGINSTGDTGQNVPNELPQVLEAWRAFQTWLAGGAKAEELPDFQVPLAA